MRRIFLLGLAAVGLAAPTESMASANAGCATALDARHPTRIGAASNFSQGWSPATFAAARQLAVPRLRDSLRWDRVERQKGVYLFDKTTTQYPELAARAGMRITLTLNWGNPLYDGGNTPHSPEALAALGQFAVAVVKRFPAIDTLEVGNEVNGANFVSGMVKEAGLAQRARYHLAMVNAVAAAVHPLRPDIMITGGATHSLPGGFLWPLTQADTRHALQGLALHPYTTPIDQLAAQIEHLCSAPSMSGHPLFITEFASQSPDRAGDDLVRAYSTFAALHAAEFDWYPLNPRGGSHVALFDDHGTLTRAGQAFRFVQSHLASYPARDASPDRFTTIHSFGDRAWVLWGAERPLAITRPDVHAYDATGTALPAGALMLREEAPLILLSDAPLNQLPVQLGCSSLIADSRLQFTFPDHGGMGSTVDPFERFARKAGKTLALTTMPGQQRAGVPWNPYLGLASDPAIHLDGTSIRVGSGRLPAEIVQRLSVVAGRPLRLRITLDPASQGPVDLILTIHQGERTLAQRKVTGPLTFDDTLPADPAGSLAISLSSVSSGAAPAMRYRIQVLDPDRCAAPRPGLRPS